MFMSLAAGPKPLPAELPPVLSSDPTFTGLCASSQNVVVVLSAEFSCFSHEFYSFPRQMM